MGHSSAVSLRRRRNMVIRLSLTYNSTLAFRLTLFVFGVYMSNTSIVNQYKQEIFLHVNQIS